MFAIRKERKDKNRNILGYTGHKFGSCIRTIKMYGRNIFDEKEYMINSD